MADLVFLGSPQGDEIKEVEATAETAFTVDVLRMASGSRAGGGAEAGSCG